MYRVIPFQPHRLYIQPAARHVANTTCADEWYDPIYGTKCSGDDSSPSSPGEGLAPLDATDTNIQRVALRPMAADCRRYRGVQYFGLYHSTTQVQHPTWRAAGCRPYNTLVTNTIYFACLMSVLRSKKCENIVHCRRGSNVPCFPYFRTQINHQNIKKNHGDNLGWVPGVSPWGYFCLDFFAFCASIRFSRSAAQRYWARF